jgi:hypothetical protein
MKVQLQFSNDPFQIDCLYHDKPEMGICFMVTCQGRVSVHTPFSAKGVGWGQGRFVRTVFGLFGSFQIF